MKKILLVLYLPWSITQTMHANDNWLSKAYSVLLGNQDASLEYAALARKALHDLRAKDPEAVPIKQMNGIGPAFARLELSSFTAFGIWLDESFLDACSIEEKIWHIYHEASHYTLRHHQNIISGLLLSASLPAVALLILKKSLTSAQVPRSAQYLSLATAVIMPLLTLYLYLLPRVSKSQEVQADLLTVDTLMCMGYRHVVEVHINNLKKVAHANKESIWWPTIAEQIIYLEKAFNERL